MKKTISINLSGFVFQIDDNAYDELDTYLSFLKTRFEGEEGAQEILNDIEARLAEMFLERTHDKKQSITLEDVEFVINAMGKPEDFGTDDDREYEQERTQTFSERKKERRLFRDPDDSVLGGVCSGLSAYFGINDPIWFRLIFVLAAVFGLAGFWIYIILWIIIPEAKTASEKLQMRGEKINIDNIERTIKNELDDLRDQINDMGKGARRRHRGRFLNSLSPAARGLAKAIIVLFAFIVIMTCVSIISSVIGIIFWPFNFSSMPTMETLGLVFNSPLQSILAVTSILLLAVIPLVAILIWAFKILLNRGFKSRILHFTLVGIWVTSLITLIVIVSITAPSFSSRRTVTDNQTLLPFANDTLPADTLRIDVKNQLASWMEADEYWDHDFDAYIMEDSVYIHNVIDLDIIRSSSGQFQLIKVLTSSGGTRKLSYEKAKNISYNYSLKGNTLYLNDYYSFPTRDRIRFQYVRLRIAVPEGKTVYLSENTIDIIYDIKNVTSTYDGDMVGHYWTMTPQGLRSDAFR